MGKRSIFVRPKYKVMVTKKLGNVELAHTIIPYLTFKWPHPF